MERCADCGEPIRMDQGSYYHQGPADDIGRSYHSQCGDPLGLKAKDAELPRLRGDNERLRAVLKLLKLAVDREGWPRRMGTHPGSRLSPPLRAARVSSK
jgi:hypothetical protein